MVVRNLIQNVNTDSELTSLTGMSRNTLVYHTLNDKVYCYEPKFINGNISSNDGGFWIEEKFTAIDLDEYKLCRHKEIDARTGELISQGFLYQGKVFSLSQNAQINILALHETRNDPALTYPVEYSTLDDKDHYNVIDADDLHAMYLTALATKKAWVDSGTTLKDSIRDSIDEQEVQAIIDNR